MDPVRSTTRHEKRAYGRAIFRCEANGVIYCTDWYESGDIRMKEELANLLGLDERPIFLEFERASFADDDVKPP